MHSEITAYVNNGDTRKIADHLVTLCEKAGMKGAEPAPVGHRYVLAPSDYWTVAVLPGKEGWTFIKSLPWNILCEPSSGVGSMRFVDLCAAVGAPGLLLDVFDGGPFGNLVVETDGTGKRFLNGYYCPTSSNDLEYYGTPLENESFTGFSKFEVFSDLAVARRVNEANTLLSHNLCFEIAKDLAGENGRCYWSIGEDGGPSWHIIDTAMRFGGPLPISGAILLAFEAIHPSQPRFKLTWSQGAYLRLLGCDLADMEQYAQAALWYRKAAELGDPEAAYQLNTLYREGKGVPKDLEQADAWLARVRPLLEREKNRRRGDD